MRVPIYWNDKKWNIQRYIDIHVGVFEVFEMSTHPGYSRVKIVIIHNSCIFLKLAPMQNLRDKIRLPIICKLAKQRKRVEQIELQGWCRKLSHNIDMFSNHFCVLSAGSQASCNYTHLLTKTRDKNLAYMGSWIYLA